ncbi:MAG TPA: 2'-5' RNA ligase family protein [Gemmatimonadaceae bacterium]|nr:2'-5' RNA ligase family protein [Gemmatimonadaceae bacterium]
MSRAKSGIFVFAPIGGDAGARIAALQRRYDPRLGALGQAPHVTLAGSSGMGPIAPDTARDELLERIGPIAASTEPITLRFGRPTRFMQTQIVVLPLDPHGPLRTLHERIKTAGFRAARPRFYFTPHVTLNLYRELPHDELYALLGEGFDEPVTIDSLEAHLTRDTGESRELARWTLGERGEPRG